MRSPSGGPHESRWKMALSPSAGNRPLMLAVGAVALLLTAPAVPSTAHAAARSASTRAAARSASAHSVLRATDGDHPAGFWYGTDSWPISISGPAPYREPVIGGAYGGYIGMTGNWATWLGCGAKLAWSAANSAEANTNYTTYGKGIGTAVYWFMGGPGVDPHYNATTAEAYAWGRAQAQRTRYDIGHVAVKYPVVFADVELPGIAPAPDNGWNSVYTSPCSGRVKANFVPASFRRGEHLRPAGADVAVVARRRNHQRLRRLRPDRRQPPAVALSRTRARGGEHRSSPTAPRS